MLCRTGLAGGMNRSKEVREVLSGGKRGPIHLGPDSRWRRSPHVKSQNGNSGGFICCGGSLSGARCAIVQVVVEKGAALMGRVFRLRSGWLSSETEGSGRILSGVRWTDWLIDPFDVAQGRLFDCGWPLRFVRQDQSSLRMTELLEQIFLSGNS